MKINEIKVPKKIISNLDKNLRIHNPTQYYNPESVLVSTLKSNGWNLLGRGSYGIVFGNPSKNYIIKFTMDRDTPYDAFAKLTKILKSKYLPRISDRKIIRIRGVSYYVYMIEKLYKADATTCSTISSAVDEMGFGSKENSIYVKKLSMYPGLVKTLQQLLSIAHKRHYSLSIWGGNSPNIMKRQDGTPVISDPFC